MEYVADWTRKVDNPVRRSVFHHILAHLELLGEDAPHVLELGSGPGLLAAFLFENLSGMTYEGLDFSAPMHALANDRIGSFGSRRTLHTVDLRENDWPRVARRTPHAVVSTQALHDVGDETAHQHIYRAALELLGPGGFFLNADFVQHKGHGASRIGVQRHLDMLQAAGFESVRSTLEIGAYACVVGQVP